MINIKIQWKHKGSDEIENAYLDLDSKLDKRLKTKVKIYNDTNQKMKIRVSDIVEIELP